MFITHPPKEYYEQVSPLSHELLLMIKRLQISLLVSLAVVLPALPYHLKPPSTAREEQSMAGLSAIAAKDADNQSLSAANQTEGLSGTS